MDLDGRRQRAEGGGGNTARQYRLTKKQIRRAKQYVKVVKKLNKKVLKAARKHVDSECIWACLALAGEAALTIGLIFLIPVIGPAPAFWAFVSMIPTYFWWKAACAKKYYPSKV